jgi:hypothetical protein
VRMRGALPFLLALVLGVATAALAACGGDGRDRQALIPQRSAERLKAALTDARRAVDDGDCDAAIRALARARTRLVNLPRAVDDQLVARLDEGLDNLETVARRECRDQDTQPETTETTTPETTPAETTTTGTTTTSTTPTDTTPTDTTPTDTTPTTDTGTTTAPTTDTAPPAETTPADPSGGTTTP